MAKELEGVIMKPLNKMLVCRTMCALLSEKYGVTFVPPDRLITKEEFYAQKQAPAARTPKSST